MIQVHLNRIFLLAGMLLLSAPGEAQQKLKTQVLVVGAGASGTTAALQCTRMGVSTILVSENAWLGGMITAAGVSAFDGNHQLPSGIWAEFRDRLYQLYGGPSKVSTGWVSNTLFEPHAGDSILKAMASSLKKLTIVYDHRFLKAIRSGKQIKGAVFINQKTKQEISITAEIVIDATELGDLMASAGIPFDLGMQASRLTGEDVIVPESNDIIQDLTYVAILKDFGKGADKIIPRPANYDSMEFDGCCNEFCSSPAKLTSNVTAQKMLDYGKLPNGKYMINWPGKGNDIYLPVIPLSFEQRQEELKKAKAKTLRFLYFLQTQFGFKQLGLAEDEFPTEDKLPFIPYYRESRRLKGIIRFKVQDISKPFDQADALYRTGIAVGDYPIDHHHRENPGMPFLLKFYPVPSYSLPIGVLLPPFYKGIIMAEKNTSISNLVNGTTRLQPVVMLTGQAAGTLAAICIKEHKQPAAVSIRKVQEQLLNDKAYIMPYCDVKPSDRCFQSVQKIGATGILKGTGQPYQWANRTWFYPDSLVDGKKLLEDLLPFAKLDTSFTGTITIGEAIGIVSKIGSREPASGPSIDQQWKEWGLSNFDKERKITRAEMAVLLDKTLDPFSREIDHHGKLK
ncbi:MAG: FAD-dependent oxidoreductase [Chitinophagaceae bacterium]|nr:FAD-dependent oxidoreductase [Chitinophagaceae bacterium]